MHSAWDSNSKHTLLHSIENSFFQAQPHPIQEIKNLSIHQYFITKDEFTSALPLLLSILSHLPLETNISFTQFCEIQKQCPACLQPYFKASAFFSLSQSNFPFQGSHLYKYIFKKAKINLLRSYLVTFASNKPYLQQKDLSIICDQFSECPPDYFWLVASNLILALGQPPWRLCKLLVHPLLLSWSTFSEFFSVSYFECIRSFLDPWIKQDSKLIPLSTLIDFYGSIYSTYFLEHMYYHFQPFDLLSFLQCHTALASLTEPTSLKFLIRILDSDGYGTLSLFQIQDYLKHVLKKEETSQVNMMENQKTIMDVLHRIFDMLQLPERKELPISIWIKSELRVIIFKLLTQRDFHYHYESSLG